MPSRLSCLRRHPPGRAVSNADFSASAPIANRSPDANQIVFHFHVHIIGGRKMPGVRGQASGLAEPAER